MTSLQFLNYGTISFSFPGIPSAIAKLTNLIDYDYSFSLYNRPIPDLFGPLKNLNYLDLSDNDWRGNGIPALLTTLPNLEFFYFENAFTDATLIVLEGMPKILEFWADFTSWGSTILTGMGLVKTLQSLSLTFCGLKGTIPTEFTTLPLLDQLWLYQNSLSGTIPPSFGQFLHPCDSCKWRATMSWGQCHLKFVPNRTEQDSLCLWDRIVKREGKSPVIAALAVVQQIVKIFLSKRKSRERVGKAMYWYIGMTQL